MQNVKSLMYSAYNKIRRDFMLKLFMSKNPDADPRSVFSFYFRNNLFGDAESLSGTGSSLQATTTIRDGLAEVIATLKPAQMLDIPCGDFNWVKEVPLGSCHYIGADVVEPLIQKNRERFGSDNHTFIVLDILSDPIPNSDLILCRDLFIHFPNESVIKALNVIKDSDSKYLLTTNFEKVQVNRDIRLGSFRPLNLRMPPFHFGEPELTIPDEDYVKFKGKTLSLWRVSDLS